MAAHREVRLIVSGLMVTLGFLVASPVNASSANLSHSYQSGQTIPNGSLVSLNPSKTDYVEEANTTNSGKLLGVAVNSNDSLLAVDATPGTTQVATTGTATALVSNVNGPIAVGDQVSPSPFNGIGMKAVPGSMSIGLAQTSFNGTGNTVAESVKQKNGQIEQIKVGYIRLSVGVAPTSTLSGVALNKLQSFVKSLTGKTVSTFRIVISLGVALVAFVALITLIYASIYGGIVSVGRNPLAKNAVYRTLSSVMIMVVITAFLAGATVYFLIY